MMPRVSDLTGTRNVVCFCSVPSPPLQANVSCYPAGIHPPPSTPTSIDVIGSSMCRIRCQVNFSCMETDRIGRESLFIELLALVLEASRLHGEPGVRLLASPS